MKNVLHMQGFVFPIKVIVFLPPLCHHRGCVNSLIGTVRFDNGDASENVVEK